MERVGLDAVEESRRDPLGDLHVGRAQVLGHDGRRGAVGRPHVPERRPPALRLRMMVDDDRDLRAALPRRTPAGRPPSRARRRRGAPAGSHLVDLDLQRLHHRQVLRPGHPAERQERCRRPRAAEQGPEGEARGHGVRIGVVLEEDADAVLVGEEVPHLLDANAEEGAVHLGTQHVAHRAAEHDGAHVRMVRQGRRPGALMDDQDGRRRAPRRGSSPGSGPGSGPAGLARAPSASTRSPDER